MSGHPASADIEAWCTSVAEKARQAGEVARRRFGEARVFRKSDRSVVTDVDFEIQGLLLAHLAGTHPSHNVIAEEREDSPAPVAWTASEYCWVVDPLDGTRNYARGIPCCAIAIGLLHQGHAVAGVIYDPFAKRLYSAVRGRGAFLDGQILRVASVASAGGRIVGVTVRRHREFSTFLSHWPAEMVLRNMGSASVHLAMVASGALDASYGEHTKLWDVVPGAVVVEEAGGRVSTPRGAPIFPIDAARYSNEDVSFLAGNLPTHRELVSDLA